MLRRRARSLMIVGALLSVFCSVAAAQIQVPVSGYEIYLGRNCVVGGQAATCGTTFTGWTGLTAGGSWLGFPGTSQGFWLMQIDYVGQPMFNGSVAVVGGKWNFLFFNGTDLHGKVTGGSVVWPADETTDIGCGAGVAVVHAALTVSGAGPASVTGCLYDLPAGSVIPPRVWGTFNL